jgi:peptide/nickel transport system permease protein
MHVGMVLVPEFTSPYLLTRTSEFVEAPPQRIRMFDAEGNFHLRPFVYGLEKQIDLKKRTRVFVVDTSVMYPIGFLVEGRTVQVVRFDSSQCPPVRNDL